MKTKIPSPVLARIQLMFRSGATLDEVAAALDLDTTWHQAEQIRPVEPAQPAPAPQPSAAVQPANDIRSPRLDDLSAKLEEHVSQLLERDDVRDLPVLAGSLDSIYQHAVAIRHEVKSPAQASAPNTASAIVNGPAQASKTGTRNAPTKAAKKTAAKGASTVTPPAIKVQPPKKKKSQDKVQPTGELPTRGRRNLVHPLVAKSADENQPGTSNSARPAGQRQIEKSPSHPVNQYRDRIALAMSEISIFDDDHDRPEGRVAGRNS